jgi:thiamine transporter ThiT
MSRAQVLVECALMVALSVALSMIPGFSLPFGGTVSWFSTLPIIAVSLRHRSRWGVAAALVYSLTQLLLGISNVAAVPAKTAGAMALCALLDYIVAYTALGFTGAIAGAIKAPDALAVSIGIALTGTARLGCSVLSGVLVWEVDWGYSLSYNALWCVPDVLITLLGAVLLSRIKLLSLSPENHHVSIE